MNDHKPDNYRLKTHLSLISLALGFLFIWTLGLSGVLLTNTYDNYQSAQKTLKLFNIKQDIGRMIFALGHEMVFTVSWLLSDTPTRTSDGNINHSLSITWNMTDLVITQVIERSLSWQNNSIDLLIVLFKLNKYRESIEKANPLDVIDFYSDLCYIVDRRSELLELCEQDISSPFLPIPLISYNLFNQGLAKRFAEIALGTFYVKSNLTLPTNHQIRRHFVSHHLIQQSFSFARASSRYSDLLRYSSPSLSTIIDDIISSQPSRGSPHLAATYINGIKQEIQFLYFATEALNSTLEEDIKSLICTRYNRLSFHMSLVGVGVIVMVLLMIIMGGVSKWEKIFIIKQSEKSKEKGRW